MKTWQHFSSRAEKQYVMPAHSFHGLAGAAGSMLQYCNRLKVQGQTDLVWNRQVVHISNEHIGEFTASSSVELALSQADRH